MKVPFGPRGTTHPAADVTSQMHHDDCRGCFEKDDDDSDTEDDLCFHTAKGQVVKVSLQEILAKAKSGEAFVGEEVDGAGGRKLYRFKIPREDAADLAKYIEEDANGNMCSMSCDDDVTESSTSQA